MGNKKPALKSGNAIQAPDILTTKKYQRPARNSVRVPSFHTYLLFALSLSLFPIAIGSHNS